MKKQERSRSTKKVDPYMKDQPSQSIKKAADIINKGGIVIYPTDTVMGIGCRWDREESIERIYQIKARPAHVPFPILLSDQSQITSLAVVTPLAQDLIKRYWPGGLTIILKLKNTSSVIFERREKISSLIARSGATRQSVGFRIPNDDTTRNIIRLAGIPIIGTSANFHGKPSVKSFKDLDPNLVKLADYVVPGQCKGGIESTVVDATGKTPVIIRKGAVVPKSLTLTVETTKREEVVVGLEDKWSKFKKELVISQQTGSQALIPAIVKILKTSKNTVKDLSAIEVDTGPGSFTGTRIGVAVANALGFSLDIPVNGTLGKIAVPTYEKSKFD
jgi:L-threonylcarbamoyladenylate synthase